MSFDPQALGVLSGVLVSLFLLNIGAIIGSYISTRERLTRIEVQVDILNRGLNGVGGKVRTMETFFKRSD